MGGLCRLAGIVSLASPALQTGLDTQGLLAEKWVELCSQLSEPSGRLGALEQTRNIAGRVARRGLTYRRPQAGTEEGGWDQGGRSCGLAVAGGSAHSPGEPALIPSLAFHRLRDPGCVTYLLSKPALCSTGRAPSQCRPHGLPRAPGETVGRAAAVGGPQPVGPRARDWKRHLLHPGPRQPCVSVMCRELGATAGSDAPQGSAGPADQ